MSRTVVAEIDLSALQRNLERVREISPNCPVAAVIKADGYGHGLTRVAQALSQADAYAVACIDEAQLLRNAGFTHPIILLEGFFDVSELEIIARQELTAVIHHEWQLCALEQAKLVAPIRAWFKVDSGMHRLGFSPEKSAVAWQRLSTCTNVAGPVIPMTHLANADDCNDQTTLQQLARFDAVTAGVSADCSIANSAAILGWRQARRGWLRPGIMLYGVSPFVTGSGESCQLQPVMTLCSTLIAVNRYKRGDPVGYGGDWSCPEDMPVGVVAIGYGDGYPRHAEPGTPVLLNGKMVPLIGRVSMDMITVDLRSQPQAGIGDPVVLWGRGLPVETIAGQAGTIAYELLCGVSRPRVRYTDTQEKSDGKIL